MMACDTHVLKQLNEAEEAEIEREELEQQAELHAILCDALDADDLLDDEYVEDDSSHNEMSSYSQENSIADDGSEVAWQLNIDPHPATIMNQMHQTSTPMNAANQLPAFQTPITVQHHQFYSHIPTAAGDCAPEDLYGTRYGTDELDLTQDGYCEPNSQQFDENRQLEVHQWDGYDRNNGVQGTVNTDDHDNGHNYFIGNGNRIEGDLNNCNSGVDDHYDYYGNEHDTSNVWETNQYGYGSFHQDEQHYGMLHGQYVNENMPQEGNVDPVQLQRYVPSCATTDNVQYSGASAAASSAETNLLSTWPRYSVKSDGQATTNIMQTNQSPSKASNIKGIDSSSEATSKVVYRRQPLDSGAGAPSVAMSFADRSGNNVQESMVDQIQLTAAAERFQRDFLHHDGQDMWSERETQMRVLLDAKTHRIDELTSAIHELSESSSREIRILKHQLLMMTDERDGLTHTLRQNEILVQAKNTEINQLNGQITALQTEISSLLLGKEDMVKKLVSLESTVESLNSQLAELGSSDALVRAKQQHESVVMGFKQKYDADLLAANKLADELKQQLVNKEDLAISLKKQLSDLEKVHMTTKREHADEINRLHRSLKESQLECRELLESHGGQEVGRLKMKLQDTLASKTLTDDLNASLQNELQELREQVRMYELVSQCTNIVATGIQPDCRQPAPVASSTLNDSYSQLAIKRPGTSQSVKSVTVSDNRSLDSGVVSMDDAVIGLKTELERCLVKLQEKSQLITKLQSELKTAKSSLAEHAAKAEIVDRKTEPATQQPSSKSLEKLHQQHDLICKENDSLKLELEELRRRLVEIADSESRVTELNVELNQQIDRLSHELAAHHETESAIHQSGNIQLPQAEYQQLHNDLLHLREQVDELQMELLSTKQLYVEICKTKDALEDENRYLKHDIVAQRQAAEKAQREQIDFEIRNKVQQLTDEHLAKLAAVETRLLQANHENVQLSEQINALRQQLADIDTAYNSQLADIKKEKDDRIREMEADCKRISDELKTHHENKLKELASQHKETLTQLQNLHSRTVADLEQLKLRYSEETTQLRNEKSQLEAELSNKADGNAQVVAIEIDPVVQNLQLEKSKLDEQLKAAESRYKKLEIVNHEVLKQHKQKVDELQRQVRDLSEKLEDAEKASQEVLRKTQESLEREHATVVTSLQEKLMEKAKSSGNQSSETDVISCSEARLMAEELRYQCLTAMEKMKATLVTYNKEMVQANAEFWKQKLAAERQSTARSLRNYYFKCLAKLLDKDFDHSYKTEFLKRMERLLDCLPEKDTNCSNSKSTTPSLSAVTSPRTAPSSGASTPRNNIYQISAASVRSTRPADVPLLALPTDSTNTSNSSSSASTPRDATVIVTDRNKLDKTLQAFRSTTELRLIMDNPVSMSSQNPVPGDKFSSSTYDSSSRNLPLDDAQHREPTSASGTGHQRSSGRPLTRPGSAPLRVYANTLSPSSNQLGDVSAWLGVTSRT